MESAWLLGLILTPLFFNRYSFQSFDPDKALLMPSLAVIAGAAWVLKRTDLRLRSINERRELSIELRWWRRPLVIPILALAGTTLLSTMFSVAPLISWWGSSYRMQGTFVIFSYMLLFWVLSDGLRTAAQWRRFQFTVMLTSFAVSLGGILQYFNKIPLLFGVDIFSGRITSNMGNPILMAGYLIMAAPITIDCLIVEIRTLTQGKVAPGRVVITCAVSLVLLSDIVAVVLSDSRGPMIGIIVAAYVAVLLYLVTLRQDGALCLREVGLALGTGVLGLALFSPGLYGFTHFSRGIGLVLMHLSMATVCALYVFLLFKKQTRWLWLSWLSHAALLAAIFLLFSFFSPSGVHGASRFMAGGEIRSSTVEVRHQIWQSVVDLFTKNDRLTGPGGFQDRLASVRRLIGYGPETFSFILLPYYKRGVAALEGQNTVRDRAHNDSFDSLAATGVLGLAANLALYFSILYCALNCLNLINNKKDHRVYVSLCVATSLCGVVVPCLFGASYLAGVGIMAGFVATILFYSAYAGFRQSELHGNQAHARRVSLLAILTAIVAHIIEIHFGIATTASQTHFYLLAAAASVLGSRDLTGEGIATQADNTSQQGKRPKERQNKTPSRRAGSPEAEFDNYRLLPYAILTGIMLLVLDWDFIFSRGETGALALFWGAWTKSSTAENQQATQLAAISIVLLTAAVGFALGTRETRVSGQTKRVGGSSLSVFFAVTMGIWLFFGLGLSGMLLPTSTALAPMQAASLTSDLLYFFSASLGVLAVALAASLWGRDVKRGIRWAKASAFSLIMLGLFLIGAVFLIDRLTIGPLRADIYYKLGLDAANSGGLQESISLFQGATDFAPYQDYYQFFLGQSLVRMAVNTNEPQLRRRIFDRAERVLKKTLEMNTFSTMNIRNLASYYVDRAELEKDPVVRANYLKDALSYYKDASKLSPSNSDLFKEWGHAHFLLDQVDAARRCYKESIDLNAENANTYTLLAELESRQGNLDEALRDISRACQISPTDLKIQSQRALLLKRLNRYNDEIASKLDALLGNNGDPATLNQMSALYVQLGDYHRALSYAQRVYALLPRDKQPAYYPTIQQLQSRLNQ